MRARAFTLVELLVTVIIVAVLVVLASGLWQQGQRGARASRCVGNLRQLAAATLLYAGEHGGQYVPAQDRANRERWHGVRGGTDESFDPRQGPLAPYLGGEGRVKECPELAKVLQGAASFEEGAGGYGYNAAYIGGTPGRPFEPEYLANVPRPARTVMFTDTAFPRDGGLQEYAFCEPFRSVDAAGRLRGRLAASVHFRHPGETANVAWCDGHVSAEAPSRLDGENLYGGKAAEHAIGWFGPEENNGYWAP